MNYKI